MWFYSDSSFCSPGVPGAAGIEREGPLEEPFEYASFLVRLWRRHERSLAAQTGDWQGEVEHIQSGLSWSFATLDELLKVLGRRAGEPSDLED